jgi:hypothetical protein
MVQGQSLTLDHVDGLYAPDTIPVGQTVTFYLRITNNDSNHGGITNGFRIYSPDGAQWGTTVADTLPLNWSQWFSLVYSIARFSIDGQGADTVGFGGSYNPLNSVGLPAGFDSVSYTITIGPIDPQYNGKTIVLDSSYYPPIGRWKWAGPDAFPSWDGPHTFTIFDPNAVPTGNLQLSPGSLNFSAQEGGSNPAAQSFNVAEAAAGNIAFTASETAPWFGISATSGTTPQDISVNVDITGLAPGDYTDSIMISSTDAANSPQYEVINLTVTPSPKNLVVSPTPLNFNAIEGGTNPAQQSFTVSEQSGAAISFTANETASWFSLAGIAGTTPDDIQVNVDITGLAPGTYTDSVEVASVEADNSPVYEVVNLTVAPSPKTLVVAPTSLDFTAPEGGPNPSAKTFNVSEEGGAAIAYTAYRAPTTGGWMTLADSTGTTPGSVTVNVDVTGLAAGTYHDTAFVMSGDASNGPLPVVVNLTVNTVVTYSLVATPDTLDFTTTVGTSPDPKAVVVTESGGGNIAYNATKTAPWLALAAGTGNTPDSLMVTVDASSLAVGTYSDTITIISAQATNSPLKVVVRLSVNEIPPAVLLAASPDSLVFTATVGGADPDTMYFDVSEVGGTNIEFSVSDTTSWFDEGGFTSGTTPATVPVAVHIGSLTEGDYYGEVMVSSAAAGNSPIYVPVFLHLVGQPNNPPTFVTEIHDTTITECDTLDMMFTAEDIDGDPVVLTLDTLVDNMTFTSDSAGNGEFVFTPSFSQSGVYPLAIHASDGHSVTTATFTVTVLDCQPGTEGDTVTVATVPAVPGAQVTVQVDIANQCNVSDISTYLAWTSSYLTLDSANFADSRIDSLTGKFFSIDNDAHTVSFGQMSTMDEMVPSGSGNLINLYFSLAVNTPADFYSIDLYGTFPTTYNPQFVRDCGSGDETVQPVFIPGGIVVDTSGNYVCGYVVDPDGNPVPGATVQLWDDFPGGMVVDTTLASGTGVFAFADFNTIPFDLWAYKDGYYPGKVEHINFAQSGIMIVLTPYTPVTPTNTNVRYYCDFNTYMDAPLPVGSVIDAYDPDGIRCGSFFVTEPGKYGFLYVYGDDPYEPGDQGAQEGDVISFYVNGLAAIPSVTPIWSENLDRQEVCLDVPNATTHTCHLREGWNLISWNLDTKSDDILTVLSSLGECLEVVQGFEQGALTYDTQLPEFSDLWQVDHLSGYWVKVSCDVDLEITGMPVPTTTPIPVTAGWNLVSYLPETSMPTADGFASIMNDLIVAQGFDSVGMTYVPTDVPHSDLLELNPCFGYWVKVRNDGELIYPGQGPSLAAQKGTGLQASLGTAFNDVTPTTQWINLYSHDLTVNGDEVTAGSRVDAYSENGAKVGSYVMNRSGHFGFMPIYAADPGTSGLTAGQSFYLTVNDVRTDQTFTWTKSGDKLEIKGLTSKSASEEPLPEKFGLHQNYPNPFNPTTTISFSLPAAGKAKIEVFNILGNLVATPFDGTAQSGLNEVVWDGRNSNGETVSSGIYFYRLSADNYNETKKMTLLK